VRNGNTTGERVYLKTPAEGIHPIKLKTYKQACSNVLSLPRSKRKKNSLTKENTSKTRYLASEELLF
jgi:hypothetical protein